MVYVTGLRRLQWTLVIITQLTFGLSGGAMAAETQSVDLPKPIVAPQSLSEGHALEHLLSQRRSVRAFRSEALNLSQLGQLLWAAQGVTNPQGYRTAPSAGALYPLELYVVAGSVQGLTAGVYHYYPGQHRLVNTTRGDLRKSLAQAALQQPWVEHAPAVLIIGAVFERTMQKYGKRGVRYAHIEAGSVAQNVYLQAQALHLGTVVVGAFDDAAVADIVRLADEVDPLILMPVGFSR
jgi:SagB-type dehydrogenase family enzyme